MFSRPSRVRKCILRIVIGGVGLGQFQTRITRPYTHTYCNNITYAVTSSDRPRGRRPTTVFSRAANRTREKQLRGISHNLVSRRRAQIGFFFFFFFIESTTWKSADIVVCAHTARGFALDSMRVAKSSRRSILRRRFRAKRRTREFFSWRVFRFFFSFRNRHRRPLRKRSGLLTRSYPPFWWLSLRSRAALCVLKLSKFRELPSKTRPKMGENSKTHTSFLRNFDFFFFCVSVVYLTTIELKNMWNSA